MKTEGLRSISIKLMYLVHDLFCKLRFIIFQLVSLIFFTTITGYTYEKFKLFLYINYVKTNHKIENPLPSPIILLMHKIVFAMNLQKI